MGQNVLGLSDCKILWTKFGVKLVFYMEISIKVFDTSWYYHFKRVLPRMPRQPISFQNSWKVNISWWIALIFYMDGDLHQNSWDFSYFAWVFLANQIVGFCVMIHLNKVWDEVDFLYANNHKSFLRVQLCFTFLHFCHLWRYNLFKWLIAIYKIPILILFSANKCISILWKSSTFCISHL